MAQKEEAPLGYVRNGPDTGFHLHRSLCDYCGSVFLSTQENIRKLEDEHRTRCRSQTLAAVS